MAKIYMADTCMHICIYTHIYVYTHTYICVYIWRCLRRALSKMLCVCWRARACADGRLSLSICVCIHTHSLSPSLSLPHTHTHTHSLSLTHTQLQDQKGVVGDVWHQGASKQELAYARSLRRRVLRQGPQIDASILILIIRKGVMWGRAWRLRRALGVARNRCV